MSHEMTPHPRASDEFLYRGYHIHPSDKPFGVRGFDWSHVDWDLGDHRHGWSETVDQACRDIDEQIWENGTPFCAECQDQGQIEVDACLDDARECDPQVIACPSCDRCSCGERLAEHEDLTVDTVMVLDGDTWAPECWEAFQTQERAAEYARARAEEAEDRANLHRGIAAGLIAMSPVLALVALLWGLR